jgi:hypothetical protein
MILVHAPISKGPPAIAVTKGKIPISCGSQAFVLHSQKLLEEKLHIFRIPINKQIFRTIHSVIPTSEVHTISTLALLTVGI